MKSPESFIAECFWPDVNEADLLALDRRVEVATEELNQQHHPVRHHPVRYLGSILMRDDEVVLCQFEGTAESVREAAERAKVPFERILAADHSRPRAPYGSSTAADRLPDDLEVRNGP